MPAYIYADESGNFDFSPRNGASRFFLLTTVVINAHAIEPDLLELRRQLAWDGTELTTGFHAANDKRFVRAMVFDILSKRDFRIDATILEKRKAEPRIRSTEADFYGFIWYHHLKHIADDITSRHSDLLITAASIGTNPMKSSFNSAIKAVNDEVMPEAVIKTAMWTAASDPCLQVADYCSWAIFRKWERADTRAYEIISDKIGLENDLFSSGNTFYY